jgi:hypothetical protein
MSEQPPADAGTAEAAPSLDTVEAVVRRQLATALGGRRGMIEAAVPTLLFTLTWLTQRNLTLALAVSVAAALVLLAVRLVQRSTPQSVLNALFGIGIGWVFVRISASRGGDEDAQALAYFLPGILYNGVYGLVFALTCVIGWPVVGFMVGSVAGDPTEWHRDPQVVRLCRNLTWMLALPCVVRVAVQLPIYLAGRAADDPGPMIAALGVSKLAMGWPLQVAALSGMAWLLGRNRTPVDPEQGAPELA